MSLLEGEESEVKRVRRVEWWWSEGGVVVVGRCVVVVGPPISSTEIQRRWVDLTPSVAALLFWSGRV